MNGILNKDFTREITGYKECNNLNNKYIPKLGDIIFYNFYDDCHNFAKYSGVIIDINNDIITVIGSNYNSKIINTNINSIHIFSYYRPNK